MSGDADAYTSLAITENTSVVLCNIITITKVYLITNERTKRDFENWTATNRTFVPGRMNRRSASRQAAKRYTGTDVVDFFQQQACSVTTSISLLPAVARGL